MTLFWIALAFGLVVMLLYLGPEWQIHVLRKAGHYPAKGQASLNDVKRLLREGHSTLALRCYREITPESVKPGHRKLGDVLAKTDLL